jgi:hypothetical protein
MIKNREKGWRSENRVFILANPEAWWHESAQRGFGFAYRQAEDYPLFRRKRESIEKIGSCFSKADKSKIVNCVSTLASVFAEAMLRQVRLRSLGFWLLFRYFEFQDSCFSSFDVLFFGNFPLSLGQNYILALLQLHPILQHRL